MTAKFKREKSLNKKIEINLRFILRAYPIPSYLVKWLLLSLIIGGLIGTASAGFLQSLAWVTNFRESHLWIIGFLPLAGLFIGLTYHYRGKNVEAGNNLLLQTIHEPKQIIPFKMMPFVFLSTLATHLFGGSAGREGTALQMAGAIADQLSKPFRLSPSERKTLLIAAIAAGFGSVFGTPLAGAIFGMEVFLIGRLKYDSIFPAFASAIIADLVTKLWHTNHTHYQIDVVPPISFQNILYATLAGLIFGLCATVFSKTLHFTGKIFKSKIKYPPLRPFIGGVILVIIIFTFSVAKYIGLGIPTIVNSFTQQSLPYDFAIKMGLTILTLAAGFKGGEVTPLFFIGATLGSALSLFLPLPVGLLAGMGFVAVFAGATNTPLACTIMAMELFGSQGCVYIAIACVVAYLISSEKGIYTEQKLGTAKHNRMFLLNKRMEDI